MVPKTREQTTIRSHFNELRRCLRGGTVTVFRRRMAARGDRLCADARGSGVLGIAVGHNRLEDVPALEQLEGAVELRVFTQLTFLYERCPFRRFVFLQGRVFAWGRGPLLLEVTRKIFLAQLGEP